MKTFKDLNGRDWVISINVAQVKRVRAALGIDLLAVADGSLMQELAERPDRFVDLVYVLVKDQAQTAGISDEAFGSGMGGDPLEAATLAFLEELTDFFPSSRREVMRKLLAKSRQVEQAALARATAKIEAMDVESLLAAPGGSSTSKSPSPDAAAALTA